MNRLLSGLIFFFCAVSCVPGQIAQPATNATVITAHRMDYDWGTGEALFTTNVVVRDSQFELKSDILIIHFDSTNKVGSALAFGNVSLSNAILRATCDKAHYIESERKVVLTGNVELREERGVHKSNKTECWLDTGRTVSTGRNDGGQISITLDAEELDLAPGSGKQKK